MQNEKIKQGKLKLTVNDLLKPGVDYKYPLCLKDLYQQIFSLEFAQ
jgi:hypothetical protein